MNTKQDFSFSVGLDRYGYEYENAVSIVRIRFSPQNEDLFKRIDFYIELEDLDRLIDLLNNAKNDINKECSRYSKEDCK